MQHFVIHKKFKKSKEFAAKFIAHFISPVKICNLIKVMDHDTTPEVVRQVMNDIPHLQDYINNPKGSIHILTELERQFSERYGDQYGTLKEYLDKYHPGTFNPFEPETQCKTIPERRTVTYTPRIVSGKKTPRKFNFLEFLKHQQAEDRAIPISFQDDEEFPDIYDEGEVDYTDLSMAEIAKTNLLIQNSRELGYNLVEIHFQKSVQTVN